MITTSKNHYSSVHFHRVTSFTLSLSLSFSHIAGAIHVLYVLILFGSVWSKLRETSLCVFWSKHVRWPGTAQSTLQQAPFPRPRKRDDRRPRQLSSAKRPQGLKRKCRTNPQFSGNWTSDLLVNWWIRKTEDMAEPCWNKLTTFKQTIPELHPWQANMLKKCLKSCPSNHRARFCSAWGITCYSWSAGTILQVSPCGSMLTM